MLAYSSPEEVVFGKSKHPVKCGFNVVIGDGEVIPEVNFTLPSVKVCRDNLREIRKLFRDIHQGTDEMRGTFTGTGGS